MKLSADLKSELRRKVFHSLSLVYLGAYFVLGVQWFLWAISVFIVLEGCLEYARLKSSSLNKYLMGFLGNIHRESEINKVSGVFWTSIGCGLTVAFFGGRPEIVTAAFCYLALGDGVAALAGKAFGKIMFRIGGRKKSLEGSMACLSVCLIAGWAAGLSLPAIGAGAVTATLVEVLPVPIDDNLWIPLGSAAVLSMF